jgi:pilus assembly protein CpaB
MRADKLECCWREEVAALRTSTLVMIGFAALFGLIAVFVAQSWLNSQAEMRMRSLESQKKPVETNTVVVASKPLRFGNELTSTSLKEIPWPQSAVPAGAFAKIADVIGGANGRRAVLTPIETNEAILSSKITGPGQRATLSATLQDGMRAVTIRVNDVEGVAGFVLPGDRVDIALTRQIDKAATTEIVLQNTRVLGIDQTADERNDKPLVVKAVTLEVNTAAAQKLVLAASVGTLSLMLRKAGEVAADTQIATISVRRPTKKEDYSVPTEVGDGAVVTIGRARAVPSP